MSRYLKAIVFFWLCMVMQLSGASPSTAAGEPVQLLKVELVEEGNIVKLSWNVSGGGNTSTIVEKWEFDGTDYWIYDVGKKLAADGKTLVLKGISRQPEVFSVRADLAGNNYQYYDSEVKARCTYFYRINEGVIQGVETRSGTVVPIPDAKMQKYPGEVRSVAEEEYEESVDYMERLAANLVTAIPNWLISVIGLTDPIELVFGKSTAGVNGLGQQGADDLVWDTFNSQEFGVVSNFYRNAERFVPLFLVAGIVMAGVLLFLNSNSVQGRLSARDYIAGLFACVLFLKLGPYLLEIFFELNRAMVLICGNTIAGCAGYSFLSACGKETRSLGSAIMVLVSCLSIGVINFQFTMRKVFLAILVGLLPIVLVNAVFPSRRVVLETWLKEFASYVFFPAAFAAGLSFFLGFMNNTTGSQAFWVKLVCLLSLTTITGFVRKVLGLDHAVGIIPGVGSALGLGALFNAGAMIRGGISSAGGATFLADVSRNAPASVMGRQAVGIAGSLSRGGMRLGVGVASAVAGSMLSGAATGEAGPGIDRALVLGRTLSSATLETAGSIRNFAAEVREKGIAGTSGVHDSAMLLDPGVSSSLAVKAIGDNFLGRTAGMVSATASRTARAASPFFAPQAGERLDRVTDYLKCKEREHHNAVRQHENLKTRFTDASDQSRLTLTRHGGDSVEYGEATDALRKIKSQYLEAGIHERRLREEISGKGVRDEFNRIKSDQEMRQIFLRLSRSRSEGGSVGIDG